MERLSDAAEIVAADQITSQIELQDSTIGALSTSGVDTPKDSSLWHKQTSVPDDTLLRQIDPETGLPRHTQFWKPLERDYSQKRRYFHAENWLTECDHSGDNSTDASATRTALKDDISLRIVLVTMRIDNISEIDLVNNTYRMEALVTCKWLAKACEVRAHRNAKLQGTAATWIPPSTPSLSLENVIMYHSDAAEGSVVGTALAQDRASASASAFSGGFVLIPHLTGIAKSRKLIAANEEELGQFASELLGFNAVKAFWCRACFNVDATLSEEFELPMFPFDEQDFSIGITVSRQMKYCSRFLDLLPDFTAVKMHSSLSLLASSSPFNLAGVVCESGLSKIKYTDKVLLQKKGIDMATLNGASTKGPPRSPEIWCTLKLLRKWSLYAAEVFSVFVVWTLSLCNFSMGYDFIAERLAYVVTLMLAISLTKNDDILGYSVVEHYRMAAMGFLGAMAICDSLVAVLADSSRLNVYCFVGFLVAYVCIHLAFAYRVYTFRVFAHSLVAMERKQASQAYRHWFKGNTFGSSLSFVLSYLTPDAFEAMKQTDCNKVVVKKSAF